MLEFALKLTREPGLMTREDLEHLRTVGFSEENVIDVVLVTSNRNFTNRVMNALGVEVDPAFDSMEADMRGALEGS
ncbi:MAG: carboxymuconolactone decarboxylase family protein [Nitrospinota bacterium]